MGHVDGRTGISNSLSPLSDRRPLRAIQVVDGQSQRRLSSAVRLATQSGLEREASLIQFEAAIRT